MTLGFEGIKVPEFTLIKVHTSRGGDCFNTKISTLDKIGTNSIAKAIVQILAFSLGCPENPNKYYLIDSQLIFTG